MSANTFSQAPGISKQTNTAASLNTRTVESWICSPGNRNMKGDPTAISNCPAGGRIEAGTRLFLEVQWNRTSSDGTCCDMGISKEIGKDCHCEHSLDSEMIWDVHP